MKAMQSEPITHARPRRAFDLGFSSRQLRILLTLSRADEAEELRQSLEGLGWEVLVAADEAAGIAALGGTWPELILTDSMASVQVWRVAVEEKSLVIVLTDVTCFTDGEFQAYVNGADLVLHRPLDFETLASFRSYLV